MEEFRGLLEENQKSTEAMMPYFQCPVFNRDQLGVNGIDSVGLFGNAVGNKFSAFRYALYPCIQWQHDDADDGVECETDIDTIYGYFANKAFQFIWIEEYARLDPTAEDGFKMKTRLEVISQYMQDIYYEKQVTLKFQENYIIFAGSEDMYDKYGQVHLGATDSKLRSQAE